MSDIDLTKITLQWMYDLGFVDAPAVINNLYENIFLTSKHIQDCEILINKETKCIFVFIKLDWRGKILRRALIHSGVVAILNKLLPEFKYRVTEDLDLLELALKKARSYDETFNPNSNELPGN